MRAAVVVLLTLAAADVIGCGLLLVIVWVTHRNRRQAAARSGEPVPPAATGQFVALAAAALLGLVLVYGGFWLLLRR